MGFLDRDNSVDQRSIEPVLVVDTPNVSKAIDQEVVRKKQIGEINALLDSLPDFNLAEYLRVVKRHTGYEWDIVLYADYGVDDKLSKRLDQKGVNPRTTIPINERLCGERLGGLFLFVPNPEPRLPGIGIRFARESKESITHKSDEWGMFREEIRTKIAHSDRLYVRFWLPKTVLITHGLQYRSNPEIDMTSFSVFDNALERAFNNPLRKSVTKTDRVPLYNLYGSGGISRDPHVGSGG